MTRFEELVYDLIDAGIGSGRLLRQCVKFIVSNNLHDQMAAIIEKDFAAELKEDKEYHKNQEQVEEEEGFYTS